jgi:hypothetical protein
MRRKLKFFVFATIFIVVFVIMFVPFVNASDEYHIYCRYRFAIYECWICESEGEGCTSDFYLFNVELGEKNGGPLEYFGIKEIEIDSINKLK